MNIKKKSSGFLGFKSKKSKSKTLQTQQEEQEAYLQSLPLNERFKCSAHPAEHYKYFLPQLSNLRNPVVFLCDKCLYARQNLNVVSLASWEEVSLALGEDSLLLPIEELPDYLLKKYDELRIANCGLNRNSFIEDFLSEEEQIEKKMSRYIEAQKNLFTERSNKLISIFTNQVNQFKEKVIFLLSSQFETFSRNVQHTKDIANSFLAFSEDFKNLPGHTDFDKEVEDLISFEALNSFVANYTHHLHSLQESFREQFLLHGCPSEQQEESLLENGWKSPLDQFLEKQNYIFQLIKKINFETRNPPKYLSVNKIEFQDMKVTQIPFEFLIQILQEHIGPSFYQPISFQNEIEELQKTLTFESFKAKEFSVESLKIDQLNSFYSTTVPALHCLHYFDPDSKVLSMLSPQELVLNPDKKEPMRIPIPPEAKIGRLTKTIAIPEGPIYFIGGEGSARTVTLEYKPTPKISPPESEKKQKRKSSSSGEDSPKNGNNSQRSGKLIISFKANMNKPRHGHSLVYMEDGSIYAIGGFHFEGQGAPTTNCERYSLQQDKWTSIEGCLFGVSHPGLLAYEGRYVYKYGGYFGEEGEITKKVERYCVRKDEWQEIDIDLGRNLPILPKSLLVQINSQEVMMLGGQNELFEFSNDCYFLNMKSSECRVITNGKSQGSDSIQSYKKTSLPFEERLVIQSMVLNGRVYCLTLKPSLRAGSNTFNIFVFDGEKWGVVL